MLIQTWSIECDECGKQLPPCRSDEPIYVISAAERQGWVKEDTSDDSEPSWLCPDCHANLGEP